MSGSIIVWPEMIFAAQQWESAFPPIRLQVVPSIILFENVQIYVTGKSESAIGKFYALQYPSSRESVAIFSIEKDCRDLV